MVEPLEVVVSATASAGAIPLGVFVARMEIGGKNDRERKR